MYNGCFRGAWEGWIETFSSNFLEVELLESIWNKVESDDIKVLVSLV